MMAPVDSLKTSSFSKHPLLMNDAELDRYSKEVRLSRRASCEALLKAREQQPVRSVRSLADSAYHVGAIPVSEGVTPAGARTYSVPIAVAPDLKLTPSISLTYISHSRLSATRDGS